MGALEDDVAGLGSVERASLAVLIRHLGWFRAVRIGLGLTGAQRRGAPFQHLPSPDSWKERGSREQAGSAILLYRALLKVLPPEQALHVTTEVVEAGGVAFLTQSIGLLNRNLIEQMSEEERRAFSVDRSARFPNATLSWDEISTERVAFTVHKCRLLELAVEAGHPELAPAFCSGDAKFFGQTLPDVTLTRPATLASGDPHCTFIIKWKDDGES